MNKKKMWKRFFNLDRHHAEGFTLVELIVVIAILAILSGVAVPAYSGYVKKANMGADQALASEVAHALALYYYANPDQAGAGYVILSANGARGDGTVGDAAMAATFGAGWNAEGNEAMSLKYDEWSGGASQAVAEAYQSSSFNGKEGSLLNQIGTLTNQLSGMLGTNADLAGYGFSNYLKDNGLDGATDLEKANAAVVYAAELAGKAQGNIADTFETYYNERINDSTKDAALPNLITGLANKNNLGNFGACASIYAQAEAFCQYIATESEDDSLLKEFHDMTANLSTDSTDAAVQQVAAAMNFVVDQAITNPSYQNLALNYVNSDGTNPSLAAKDTNAFLAAMSAIKDNENYLLDRVGMDGCYTDGTVAGLLNDYIYVAGAGAAEGEIAITLNPDGTVNVFPTNVLNN